MTNSIDDLGQADVILVVGSNTTEAHPIVGIELKKAARNGTRVIVIDPRRIALVDHADRWLRIQPGTNVPLFNAMMRIIIEEGLTDETFIADRTEGFTALRDHVLATDIEQVAEMTGVPTEQIADVARTYATAERASIVYCMGVTQHASGTGQVRTLANLAMLTGQIGQPGTGVNPLRGQNNVQGACDLACLPDCLPGYRMVSDHGALDRVCDFWDTQRDLGDTPGLTIVEMLDAACEGTVKAMYIMGENPVIADPDQAHVRKALDSLDFLVVQDIFATETSAYADVVLPAASFLEKDGTFTNTDRRIQRVRKVVDAPGDALPDLDIVCRVANAMGLQWDYEGPREVMDELREVTPQYGGVTYSRLDAEGGLQWPCPDETHPGTPVLHTEAFTRGKGAFAVVDHAPTPDATDQELPLTLVTGRHLWNFHTNTMTGRADGLAELNPAGYVEIATEDAERLGICQGDVVEITSRRGTVHAHARLKGGIRPGVVFMPFHFADAPANALTSAQYLDPHAKMPGLKSTAVRIRLSERRVRG